MKYIRSLCIVLIGLFLKGNRKTAKNFSSNQDNSYVETDDGTVDSPADLTKTGWKAALLRTKQALKDKNLSMSAAALSYYTTLAFFPAALGLATFYTAVAGPQALLNLLNDLELVVPPAIQDMLQTQLSPLARAAQTYADRKSVV